MASQIKKIAPPRGNDCILFLSPHPDDEVIAAGGYLQQVKISGAKIIMVLITDGNRRGKALKRAKEWLEALGHLDIHEDDPQVELIRLDLPDGSVKKHILSLENKLSDIITQYSPTIVIAPHPSELHKDHRVIGDLAVNLTPNTATLLLYLIHHPPFYPWPRKYAPQLPLNPPGGHLGRQTWVSYELSQEQLLNKEKAMQAYASQLRTPFLRSLMLAMIRRNELFIKD